MKRFFYFSLLSLLCAALPVRAEDAAAVAARQEADENYKMMKAKMDDLSESRTVLQNRIQSLEKQVTELRAQVAKPPGNFATTEDLKRLADAIQEVDKKRIEDNKKVIKELGDLGNSLTKTSSHHKETPHVDDPTPTQAPAPDQPTFTYTVKSGDSYSTIAKAYREQGVKVTAEQIEKANPNIKPTELLVRMKIQIPDTRVGTNKPDAK